MDRFAHPSCTGLKDVVMHSTISYAGRVLIVESVPANFIGHHSILKWDSLIEVSPKVNDALVANKALAINPERVVSTLALRGQYGVITGKTPVGLSRLSARRALQQRVQHF